MADWMTYAEAAERLGSTPDAVRVRSKRQKWPTLKGNAPKAAVRVQIPPEVLEEADRAFSARLSNVTDQRSLDELEARIRVLEEQNAELRADKERMAEDLAGERRRVDSLLDRLSQLDRIMRTLRRM